jgi:hypothetical protein
VTLIVLNDRQTRLDPQSPDTIQPDDHRVLVMIVESLNQSNGESI